ncbi:MAG TPA: DNA repair protein RecO, partial [Chitinophagaceae bacterium]|nr:DNA repair protein RecO [Chitinophagaceae bacterium]
MLHETQGLVLRTVRYGESSVIVNIFTELFGIQSYLVNGVRTANAKSSKANLLQPANQLELVTYHRDGGHLQRLKDFRYAYLYRSLYADVVKNAIALYLVELMDKTLRQPEAHPELFHFVCEALQWMDGSGKGTGNLPLLLSLRVGELLGFGFYGKYCPATPYLDLKEGFFTAEPPSHTHFLDEPCSRLTDRLLRLKDFDALKDIPVDKPTRHRLLAAYQDYYYLHLPDFKGLKSPKILA